MLGAMSGYQKKLGFALVSKAAIPSFYSKSFVTV